MQETKNFLSFARAKERNKEKHVRLWKNAGTRVRRFQGGRKQFQNFDPFSNLVSFTFSADILMRTPVLIRRFPKARNSL